MVVSEAVEGELDRWRWTGNATGFNRHDYEHYLEDGVDDLLLKTGMAARAFELIWGRRATIWEGVQLFVAIPGNEPAAHRDFVPFASTTEPEGQVRLWTALTQLDDGEGAIALVPGSHLIPDRPGDSGRSAAQHSISRVLHPDDLLTPRRPPVKDLLGCMRTTRMAVGDAVVFRSDVVHASAPNRGDCLRLALVLTGHDARIRGGLRAGMSLDCTRELIDIEWVVLSLVAVQPTSPWQARCACYPRGIVGRLWTEHPPERVERAFVTLHARGLIEPQDGSGKALQSPFVATPDGRSEAVAWLATPDSRDAYLLPIKLLLCDWLGVDTTDLTVVPAVRPVDRTPAFAGDNA